MIRSAVVAFAVSAMSCPPFEPCLPVEHRRPGL